MGDDDGAVGRYRLERKLGAGGMGVVHAALDVDLERRVALKVLHHAGSAEGRQRLLREARAMARVTHENVALVHDVGSASGRDYIAMELIEGGTLHEWLATKPSHHEILRAFIAAGRGLAAAHAAGLVHRDFKPGNVLRRKDGRIVVTDFGLARGHDAEAEPREASASPSSLPELTQTGALVGTPAYMAPEQWIGASVGPAADQFAFCVALWEALAGERPFQPSTIEAVRADAIASTVEASGTKGTGPLAHVVHAFERGAMPKLDDSKVPRRLRNILRRGLDPDPAKRWPSMEALLAAITRGERWRIVRLAVAVIGATLLVAAGASALFRAEAQEPCRPPQRDPAKVWRASEQLTIKVFAAARGNALGPLLDTDLKNWREVRERGCKLAPEQRRTLCLDAVIERFDFVVRTARLLMRSDHVELERFLVDPRLCERADWPRLQPLTPRWESLLSEELLREHEREPLDAAAAQKLIDHAKQSFNSCVEAIARIVVLDAGVNLPGNIPALEHDVQGVSTDVTCWDEHVAFDVARAIAADAIRRGAPQAEIATRIDAVGKQLARIPQRDLEGDLALLRAKAALLANKLDEAIALADKATEDFGAERACYRSSMR